MGIDGMTTMCGATIGMGWDKMDGKVTTTGCIGCGCRWNVLVAVIAVVSNLCEELRPKGEEVCDGGVYPYNAWEKGFAEVVTA